MIKIKNLDFSYSNSQSQTLFQSLNLEIQKGEAVLITGINGTGKTTLLRLMAGVLHPQKGFIEYSDELGKEPKKKIGFISDQMHLYEEMSLKAAIEFHSNIYRITDFNQSLMEAAGLSPDQKIKDLSAGQKLIFHLSLVLAIQPEIILIDEVIHSIDTYLRDIFLNSIIELMAQKQLTLVMVNLNFHDIEKIPQRVILLRNGKIAVDESIDDLKQKVKKIICNEKIDEDFPVLYSSAFADTYEYYIYPYKEHFGDKLEGKVVDLNLDDIIKAFIGGEYV